MRPVLALLVFLLDVVALISVLGTRAPARRKLAWVLAIVGLPFVGAIVWYWRGVRKPTGTEPI